MKNETDRGKDKSKISVLKKKLSSTTETVSEEPEVKSRKGKKLKKFSEENVKSSKSSFARKFNFGKYINTSSEISRASSSKSMSESDSDKVSSGYSTLTPTSQKCDEIEDKFFEETYTIDTCPEEGIETNPPPISVTPYAISTWRSDSDKAAAIEVAPQIDVATGAHDPILMENKIDDNKDSEQVVVEDGEIDQAVKKGSDDIENKEADKSENLENTDTASEAMPAFGNLVMDLTKERPDHPSNISQSVERKEHLYKILVIGELGTGKTSIIKRYVHQFFSQHYRATIGVDFALKVLNWDANTIIRLQLWDIAGQERFGNMTRVYYKDAVGAFIVFDVTRVATFDAVDKWKQDLDSKVQLPDGSSIPCVLLGNKCDQQKEGIVNTPNRMDEYCKEKGFSGWFETSAKENINIEEAAKFLVNKILLNDKLLHSSDTNKDTDRIAIDDKGNANGYNLKSSKTCSC